MSRSLLGRRGSATISSSTAVLRCIHRLLLLHLLLGTALQSLEVDAGNVLVESLALRGRELNLLGRRHAGSIAVGESAGAPGGAAAHLAVVAEDVESGLVAQRHVDDAVVSQGAHGRDGRALLPAALRRRADEQARVLAPEAARLPLLARVVPEGPPLRREVAVARGDSHQEGVVLLQGRGVGHLGDRAVLFGRVHLRQDFLGEGLGDAVQVDHAAGFPDALGLGLGELLDVAIGGVLEG